MVPQCAEQIKNLYTMFLDVDCLQLEVNPLAETPQGKVSDDIDGLKIFQHHSSEKYFITTVQKNIYLTCLTYNR